jgi:hypothetical protein
MKKKGGVLFVIGIILLAIILIAAGAAFYFYNYYVFKTFHICVTNEINDTQIPCSSDDFCIGEFRDGDEMPDLDGFPPLIGEKVSEAFDLAIFCEESCKFRRIRGIGDGADIQSIDSCEPGDDEITLDIRGKEGLALLKFVKEQGDLMS